MKRPQGFDRPAPPRTARAADPVPAAEPDARPKRGATRPDAGVAESRYAEASRAAAGSAPGSRVVSDADRITTEPITVVTTSPFEADARASTGVTATIPSSPGLEPDPSAGPPLPEDPRAAKKALAAAARERRKYERQEVRRFTKRSRRRRMAWSIGLGAIAALVVVVAVGAYSPLMALREVRVEGAQRVPAADIQAAFGPTLGTPLPLIASSDVHDVLSAFPLIETYSTETIPPGTLVVRIVERTPVGVIETGEGLALVDAAGVVIERPAERPEGQPLIIADGGIAGEGFRAAAAVIRSLPADVRATLVGVQAATPDDVRLELGGGASVVWGSAEDSAFKAAVLARLMGAAPPDTVSAYDVSSPSSPVTK